MAMCPGRQQVIPYVWDYLGRGNRTQCRLSDYAKKWHLIVMEVVGSPGKFLWKGCGDMSWLGFCLGR